VYATVRKERRKGRVVSIRRAVVLGDEAAVEEVLRASVCSRTINTSLVERRHATDRGRNARKTYRFRKDWRVHEAMTYDTTYKYNFCWPVRTLRAKGEDGEGSRVPRRWQRAWPTTSGLSRSG
jgi:hypothetical protein